MEFKISPNKSITISLPSIPEQDKIVEFLSEFDKRIKVEKAILQDWLGIKKGLLQQMFA